MKTKNVAALTGLALLLLLIFRPKAQGAMSGCNACAGKGGPKQ